MDALAAQDGAALLSVADDMAARSLSWSAALQDLGTLLNRIAIAQAVPAALPDDLPELEDIQRLAGQFSAEDIQLFYQIVVHGRQELGLAPDEYAGFTMTLLRMLAFTPLHSSGEHKTQSMPAAALAKTSTAAKASIPAAATVVASKINESSAPATKAPSPAMAALAAARSGKSSKTTDEVAPDTATPPFPVTSESIKPSSIPSQKKTELNSAPVQAIVNDAVEQSAAPINIPRSSSTTATTATSKIDWPVVVRKLELRGVAQQLATQSELLSVHEDDVVIKIELRIPVDTLLSAGSVEKLATALTSYLNKKVSITTEIGVVRQTAHAASLAEQAERLQQAEQTLESDPFVQTLKREFGATIVPGSVRPI